MEIENNIKRRPGMKITGSFVGKIAKMAKLPNGKRLIATDSLEFYIWDNDKLTKMDLQKLMFNVKHY